jgi:predicted peptidase
MVIPYPAVDTGTWALHNDNAIVDYTYRAFHLTVQAAKNVVQAYYGRAGSRSYYLSCSTGGRQGLREAQQYPEDFDGVVSRVEREHAHTKHAEHKLGFGLGNNR